MSGSDFTDFVSVHLVIRNRDFNFLRFEFNLCDARQPRKHINAQVETNTCIFPS